MISRKLLLVAVLAMGSLALGACGGDEEEAAAATTPPPTTPPPTTTNAAPAITGTPSTSVTQGTQYSFTPSATDANSDMLTFSIAGRPSWATFNTATGRLQGTPTSANVGTFSSIVISVSDGTATATLAAFNIQVLGTTTGSVTLQWMPPTTNTDGSTLSNLAGYKIYWGTTQGSYPNSVTVNNPGLATYVVDQLAPTTWYFVTTAINNQGIESAHSNVASKVVL